MSGFNEREKDFENKHAYEQKMGFKIEARTCKIFGLWIAEKLGLSGADAERYALEVVGANLEIPGFDDVLNKVNADLAQKQVEISDHLLRTTLEKSQAEAREQIMKEGA